MPLFDHFHPPLLDECPWESFHGYWAGAMALQLNTRPLPPDFIAYPQVRFGAAVEVDVATLERLREGVADGGGGLATAVYAPPEPALTFVPDFAESDTFELRIYLKRGGLRLVGAVELVSPSNKDRPSHRQAFIRKCAAYLQQGVALIIVDIVTNRTGDLHAELVQALAPALGLAANPTGLYAVAYRYGVAAEELVGVWPAPLVVGQALPTLPLWLGPDLVVPLDLDASYRATCEALRIRVA